MKTTAENLYLEVFKKGTEICLVYTTVLLTFEKEFANKKAKSKVYSKIENCFTQALDESSKGNQSKAEELTKAYLEYQVFTWCRTKTEFIKVVEEIYKVLKEKEKVDAYYVSEGNVPSLQIHLD